jgi:integrase/recombinase XerD
VGRLFCVPPPAGCPALAETIQVQHDVFMEEYLTTAGADSPISAFIPTYLEHLRIDGKSTVTLERYQERLQRFIAEMGDCRPDEITAEKVSLYRRQLMDSSVGPVTIGGFLSCLRGFLKYLRDVRGLRVMDGEKIKRPRIPQRSVEYLTKEELDRLLGAIPTHTWNGLRDRALIEVLFSSGMRISEVLGLDRAALEWELRQAVIIGKGRKERKVYFSEEAIDWLTKYLSTCHDDYPAVFVTTGSPPKRLRAHGTWKRFNRYGQIAGLAKRVYPHLLRHTMATTLLANGCPIGHIRVLLGHTHLATTCRYYLGMMSDAEAKAAHDKYLYKEKDVIDDEERWGKAF